MSENQQQEIPQDAVITDADVDAHLKTEQENEKDTVASIDAEKDDGKPAVEKSVPPQHVPLAVHIREREKHQRERQEWMRQQEVVNERLQRIFAVQQQQAAATQEQPPDENTDPIGASLYAAKVAAAEAARLRQAFEEDRQQRDRFTQQQQMIQQVQASVQQDEAAFAQEHPDYQNAVRHARDVKYAEYTALGLSHGEAVQKLQADAWALAMHARNNGVSVAEYAYQLAHALGYRPAASNGDGTATEAEKVLEMRKAGQRLATGGGGGSKKSAPTFAELAAMSEEEFAQATSGDRWRQIAG